MFLTYFYFFKFYFSITSLMILLLPTSLVYGILLPFFFFIPIYVQCCNFPLVTYVFSYRILYHIMSWSQLWVLFQFLFWRLRKTLGRTRDKSDYLSPVTWNNPYTGIYLSLVSPVKILEFSLTPLSWVNYLIIF